MSTVTIKRGKYRNINIENTTFPMLKPYKEGAAGGFVTVDASELLGTGFEQIRVKVDAEDIVVDGVEAAEPVVQSDEERMAEIEERFAILEEMSGALKSGDVRALIVTGPPGVGKSYGIEKTLEAQDIFTAMAGRKPKYEVVKGAMTPLGLYAKLYEYSDANCVLVFDDCDSVLMDDLALNILKAALDSGKKRKIYWNADSAMLRKEGIPNSFEFKGSACFVTNIKFENVKSKRLQDHLEALQSRCHYLDLTLDTMRDKFLRIKQIANKGDLFQGYGFEKEAEQEILDFMYENRARLREMSLRMALKIADLKKISKRWQALAKTTCMKRA